MAVDDAGASGSGTAASARVDGLLAKAHGLKAEGNALYKEGKWGEAIAKFFEVIATVTAADRARNLAAATAMGLGSGDGNANGTASDLTPEQQAQVHELTVSANLNMAAALIKVRASRQARSRKGPFRGRVCCGVARAPAGVGDTTLHARPRHAPDHTPRRSAVRTC